MHNASAHLLRDYALDLRQQGLTDHLELVASARFASLDDDTHAALIARAEAWAAFRLQSVKAFKVSLGGEIARRPSSVLQPTYDVIVIALDVLEGRRSRASVDGPSLDRIDEAVLVSLEWYRNRMARGGAR
jgi:hypothetical protein